MITEARFYMAKVSTKYVLVFTYAPKIETVECKILDNGRTKHVAFKNFSREIPLESVLKVAKQKNIDLDVIKKYACLHADYKEFTRRKGKLAGGSL